MSALPITPSVRLDCHRALVTGAGRGIALALAAALGEVGANATLEARSADEIKTGATFVETPVTKQFFEDETFRGSISDRIKWAESGGSKT